MLEVDDELFGGVGVGVEVMPRRLWLLGETHAAVGVQGTGGDVGRPVEALGGARYAVADTWLVQAGIGAGIGHGYGTPAVRGIVSMAYAPQPPPVLRPVTPPPAVAEPEPAPEPPPRVDTDGDGLFDDEDECPTEIEDVDGFQDDDGCPDPDNDGDRIADVDDKCPLEAEVINGVDDADGCPDEGLLAVVDSRIVLDERVLFDTNRARVKRRGRKVLKVIAVLWREHPEWDHMVIEGHTDHRGPDDYNLRLSERRARRVRERLIQYGVPADKLEFVGYGRTRPRVEGRGEEALQANRRVEFVIFEKAP